MTDDARDDSVSRSRGIDSAAPSLIPLPQNQQLGAWREAGGTFVAQGPGGGPEEAGAGPWVPKEVRARASSVSRGASCPVPEGNGAAMGAEGALARGVRYWPHLRCTVATPLVVVACPNNGQFNCLAPIVGAQLNCLLVRYCPPYPLVRYCGY